MSSVKRLFKLIYGLLMLLCAALLLIKPKEGSEIVVAILALALLIYGLKMLIYYFTMARFMVGGIMTLYKSIIVIDFGLFIFYMDDLPYRFMMLYLVAVMAFHGATSILGALEMKRLEIHSWNIKLLNGIINMILAVVAMFMFGTEQMVTILFCIGLITNAFYNIVKAFKKSAIIYIG